LGISIELVDSIKQDGTALAPFSSIVEMTFENTKLMATGIEKITDIDTEANIRPIGTHIRFHEGGAVELGTAQTVPNATRAPIARVTH